MKSIRGWLAAALLIVASIPLAAFEGWGPSGGSSFYWPDGYSNTPAFLLPGSPYAAYSTRKVVSAYSGKSVNVTRQSDVTTQDIGFVGNDFDVASFNTFCSGTLCFVAKWYDQSGNGRDISQATFGNQPQIVISNGRAWLGFGPRQSALVAAAPFPGSGDHTLGMTEYLGTDLSNTPMSQFDGANGWMILNNGLSSSSSPKHLSYWAQVGGETIDTTDNLVGNGWSAVSITRASGALTEYVNGVSHATATSISSSTSTSAFSLGNIVGGQYFFWGLTSEVYVYTSGLTPTNISSIAASETSYWPNPGFATPYSGVASVQLGGEYVQLGNILEYEYTQPWTVFAAIQLYAAPAGAGIVFTNVVPPAAGTYPGYEVWIDASCHMIVRLIHSISANQFIDVHGTTPVCDMAKHEVAVSYSGSGTAAGVNIYIDGTLETVTVPLDTLGGLSIVAAGQSLNLGFQQGESFWLPGTLNHFQLDNIARSGAYIAAHSTPSSLPPIDGNTAISLPLTEGSGTTAHDASGNGRNGTLTSGNMWVP